MPELPEVETTCRGIAPHLQGQLVTGVDIRQAALRWPVPDAISALRGQRIHTVSRRAKYLLLGADRGHCIVHLGMSGSLRVCPPDVPLRPHDHVILSLHSGLQLRYHDPRRFGCWLWTDADPASHQLLHDLGPEPLEAAFSPEVLLRACKRHKRAIKTVVMDPHVVVGVGNIYACEALFAAAIDPRRRADRISAQRIENLTTAIKFVLQRSIDQGGTTLRDFLREDGRPGYFKQQLNVYDRADKPCHSCAQPIRRSVLGQRTTYFCPHCQH
jgi:formamidopyrimidine-DNA glycosylase